MRLKNEYICSVRSLFFCDIANNKALKIIGDQYHWPHFLVIKFQKIVSCLSEFNRYYHRHCSSELNSFIWSNNWYSWLQILSFNRVFYLKLSYSNSWNSYLRSFAVSRCCSSISFQLAYISINPVLCFVINTLLYMNLLSPSDDAKFFTHTLKPYKN